MNEDTIKYIIARMLDNINEMDDTDDEFTKGQRLAYYTMLDTVKNELIVRDVDLKEFALDFNLENLL